jgi:hypothetical protein
VIQIVAERSRARRRGVIASREALVLVLRARRTVSQRLRAGDGPEGFQEGPLTAVGSVACDRSRTAESKGTVSLDTLPCPKTPSVSENLACGVIASG